MRIGVIGAGTMGSGIAQVACLGGLETLLHDPDSAALDTGAARLDMGIEKGVENGWWASRQAATARRGLAIAPSLEDLGRCDLVIEAAPEDLELKRSLFRELAAIAGSETIFASNTSSLPITAIADGLPHPERVVGMHFFNPPFRLKLVEVVATAESDERALAATVNAAEQMGRTPLRAKDSPGFIANRLARPFTLEPLRQLGRGLASAPTIDRICRTGGGFRMGPFELLDLIGLDVNLSVARSFYQQGGEPERWRPSSIQEGLVAEGKLGRKSGHGFYAYDNGDRAPEENLAIEAPTLDLKQLGRIDPAGPRILPRLFSLIVNEAAFALEEGICAAADMDTAMRLGFNWPLGPLEIADLIGPARAVELLDRLLESEGDAYRPAPLLRSAASDATPLRDCVLGEPS